MINLKNLLVEGSSILYRIDTLSNVIEALNSNKFILTTNLGTESDQRAMNLPYFLSMSRSKVGGYQVSRWRSGYVHLVIDGNYLNRSEKIVPVDYWGKEYQNAARERLAKTVKDVGEFRKKYEENPKIYDFMGRNPEDDMSGAIESYMAYDETEERLLSGKPILKNARKIIMEVHASAINIDDAWKNKEVGMLRKLETLCNRFNIPFYLHTNENSMKILNKRQALRSVDEFTSEAGIEHRKDIREPRPYSYEDIEMLINVVTARNKVDVMEYSRELDALSDFRFKDLTSKISASVHNIKGTKIPKLVRLLYTLTKLMKGLKLKTLDQIVAYAVVKYFILIDDRDRMDYVVDFAKKHNVSIENIK